MPGRPVPRGTPTRSPTRSSLSAPTSRPARRWAGAGGSGCCNGSPWIARSTRWPRRPALCSSSLAVGGRSRPGGARGRRSDRNRLAPRACAFAACSLAARPGSAVPKVFTRLRNQPPVVRCLPLYEPRGGAVARTRKDPGTWQQDSSPSPRWLLGRMAAGRGAHNRDGSRPIPAAGPSTFRHREPTRGHAQAGPATPSGPSPGPPPARGARTPLRPWRHLRASPARQPLAERHGPHHERTGRGPDYRGPGAASRTSAPSWACGGDNIAIQGLNSATPASATPSTAGMASTPTSPHT